MDSFKSNCSGERVWQMVTAIAEEIIEEGRQKGRLEGKFEGKQEAALMMLREGSETAFIAKVTGLSVTGIERLRASQRLNR